MASRVQITNELADSLVAAKNVIQSLEYLQRRVKAVLERLPDNPTSNTVGCGEATAMEPAEIAAFVGSMQGTWGEHIDKLIGASRPLLVELASVRAGPYQVGNKFFTCATESLYVHVHALAFAVLATPEQRGTVPKLMLSVAPDWFPARLGEIMVEVFLREHYDEKDISLPAHRKDSEERDSECEAYMRENALRPVNSPEEAWDRIAHSPEAWFYLSQPMLVFRLRDFLLRAEDLVDWNLPAIKAEVRLEHMKVAAFRAGNESDVYGTDEERAAKQETASTLKLTTDTGQSGGDDAKQTQFHHKRFAELTNETKKLYAWIEPDVTTDPPQSMDDLNPDDFLAWRVKARSLLKRACGSESEYYKEFLALEERSYRKYFEMLDSLSAVFSAAKEDYEGGHLQTLVQGDKPAADSEATPEDPLVPSRSITAYDDEVKRAAKEDFHPSVDFLEPLVGKIKAAHSHLDGDAPIRDRCKDLLQAIEELFEHLMPTNVVFDEKGEYLVEVSTDARSPAWERARHWLLAARLTELCDDFTTRTEKQRDAIKRLREDVNRGLDLEHLNDSGLDEYVGFLQSLSSELRRHTPVTTTTQTPHGEAGGDNDNRQPAACQSPVSDKPTAEGTKCEQRVDRPAGAEESLPGDSPNKAQSTPAKLKAKEQKALDFIREHNGGIKGLILARKLGIEESTLRKHYIPKLKTHGVKNDKNGDGYYIDPK